MSITIEPLCLRSATWVGANMRDADKAEIMCQLPPTASMSDAGAACYYSAQHDWRWEALIDNSPVACFGLSQLTFPLWYGWAFGTPQMRRAIPAISRHFKAQKQRIIDAGCRCIEVRPLKSHGEAHLWLRSLGGKYRTDLRDRGRNGETFELWSWEYTETTSEKTESKDAP